MTSEYVRKPTWKMRVMLSVAMVVCISIAFSTVGFAADAVGNGNVEATVPVSGTINAVSISVTHPASVDYTINPNMESGTFIAPDITITNNSQVPVTVTVKSLASATGGTLQFTDVAANAKDWTNLNLADSKTFIALGVKIADETGWNDGYDTNTHYAVDISDVLFGSLNADSTGNMTMIANHGLAFDQIYTSTHNLIFMFSLV